MTVGPGPLGGVRVLELATGGPATFAAQLLADLGAEVIRVDRPVDRGGLPDTLLGNPLFRSRRSIGVDLRSSEGAALIHDLAATCAVVVDGMRPGHAERLGLGPEDLRGGHPSLVYGRMSAWGPDAPDAQHPAHALNAEAVSGILDLCGRAGDPVPTPPLNLLGSFAVGSVLATGLLAALVRAQATGAGDLVDLSIVDGVATLAGYFLGVADPAGGGLERGHHLLGTGAPCYETYATADGRSVAVAAIEEGTWQDLLDGTGLAPEAAPDRNDPASWPAWKALLEERFATNSRDHWLDVFRDGRGAVSPVLTLAEAVTHRGNEARGTFLRGEQLQPRPSPRFADAGAGAPRTTRSCADTREIALECGRAPAEVERLIAAGVLYEAAS